MEGFIILITIIFNGFVFAQSRDIIINGNNPDVYYKEIEKVAEFPGGLQLFRETIAKKF